MRVSRKNNGSRGQTIRRTLIRTSSYFDGFIAQRKGGIEGLETTIRDPTIQSVTANVTFRSLDKTEVLSNAIGVNLNLISSADTTTTHYYSIN